MEWYEVEFNHLEERIKELTEESIKLRELVNEQAKIIEEYQNKESYRSYLEK